MRANVNIYPSRDELSVALAAHVANLAALAGAKQGRFSIALSGGSLLEILAPALCSEQLHDNINWSCWHVFWVDERWVPRSSPASNYGLAEDLWFSRVSIPREQIHAIDNSINPSATARNYESVMQTLFQPRENQMPRFDLILLGIGEDGHTASLFPGHPLLAETRAWVAPVLNAPKPPAIRITMTLPLINNGRNVVFVAAGAGKADIVAKVLTPHNQRQKLPAELVRPTDGTLWWFLDQAAGCSGDRGASG
ncbi:6-phosphogluconolactonase [Desulfopila sp. IMCC35006]|uniref:6-phosphogluconolactonase n=1 Tax=Desulfopila sp. IMCC35006 TaxID=2569542 RepID=UPI0010AD74B0|nr:6-phosphogluconolactonase [Desulfopila sp. IMCC35006]TKB26190.1 6-phosphogluconolactonase [Desulfopila sp. IMCC35006]